jgi:tyrosyl-tRNA synthetase
MSDLLSELTWRGLVYEATEGLGELLASQRVTAYVGIDPSASSLHVGSLLPVMALARIQRFGHLPIAIVGGATGMIGDPSGKSQERVLLSRDRLEENVSGIRAQLEGILGVVADSATVRILNNADWLAAIDLVTFLRDTGKHFTVSYMLQKDAVDRRLSSEEGLSYTEFSYLLLQAYDFLHLHDTYGCVLQVGGSDQWGNITAGIDLIRRVRGGKAHGLVWPLMTTSSGAKFGKTEAGAIWLDPRRTSPFRFYQFWRNTEDRDVVRYLKFFTFLDRTAIDALEDATRQAPERRQAQQALAREVTAVVHGAEQVARAERATRLLFGEEITSLSADEVLAVFDDVPSTEIAASDVEGAGIGIVELVARVRLAASKSEARRLVQAGGVYVNNRRVADLDARVVRANAIDGRLFVLRKGQKENHLVRLT